MHYNIGTLVLVRDPCYDHDIICVVIGIGTATLFENKDNVLYHGFSLSHNHPYYFFDVDIVKCLSVDEGYRHVNTDWLNPFI